MLKKLLFGLTALLLASAVGFCAQESKGALDRSRIPLQAKNAEDFVPPGWKLQEQVTGDLNGDSIPDVALKLVQEGPAEKDGMANERQRVLVVLFRDKAGLLRRAAVAERLLQCTTCGGAFYGVVEAPARVRIEKGVLIVNQDHGSREITELTYRFRYDPDAQALVLIGFDLQDTDRAEPRTISESTNYLTGVRIVTRTKGGKSTTSKASVAKAKISVEKVDSEELESAAAERLDL